MNKMRKKLSMVVLGVVLVMALSVTAFASSAWDSFSTKLPANQGDTEVSTVARASDSVDHFNIQINSLCHRHQIGVHAPRTRCKNNTANTHIWCQLQLVVIPNRHPAKFCNFNL